MHQAGVDSALSLHSLVFWIIFFAAYWLPTFLAFLRNIREKTTVILLNIFAFLFIPWLVALVFAVVATRQTPTAPPGS
jgi:hypothetical protein